MPDSIWERGSNALYGQQEILASLSQRSATLFTRHYVTNSWSWSTADQWLKVFGLTVYRSDKGTPPTLPVDRAVAAMLADLECELLCNDHGSWLIRRLDPRITFSA